MSRPCRSRSRRSSRSRSTPTVRAGCTPGPANRHARAGRQKPADTGRQATSRRAPQAARADDSIRSADGSRRARLPPARTSVGARRRVAVGRAHLQDAQRGDGRLQGRAREDRR
ncbi:hypothetical protein ACFPRL_03000 [Pseudoclavibacter helvolus]